METRAKKYSDAASRKCQDAILRDLARRTGFPAKHIKRAIQALAAEAPYGPTPEPDGPSIPDPMFRDRTDGKRISRFQGDTILALWEIGYRRRWKRPARARTDIVIMTRRTHGLLDYAVIGPTEILYKETRETWPKTGDIVNASRNGGH